MGAGNNFLAGIATFGKTNTIAYRLKIKHLWDKFFDGFWEYFAQAIFYGTQSPLFSGFHCFNV